MPFALRIQLVSASALWIAAVSVVSSRSGSAAELPNTTTDAGAIHETSVWTAFVEPGFPFFSSVLDARQLGPGWPADNLTPRGIILNVGEGCWACFDTELLRVSAIWTGPGASPVSMAQGSYHQAGVKVPEGQEKLPRIVGTPWLANGIYPGWQTGDAISLSDPREPAPDASEVGRGPLAAADGRFKAIRLIRGGVYLDYEVAGMAVRERVEAHRVGGSPVIRRSFHLEEVARPLWLLLGRRPEITSQKLTLLVSANRRDGHAAAELAGNARDPHAVRVRPSTGPVEFSVTMGFGGGLTNWKGPNIGQSDPPETRWSETVITRGTLSTAGNAYVVDRIALPLDNPWKRNVRLADIAFFRDGRAAAVTFDGDVWMISGLAGELHHVTWQRFTSGLHEPLGICIRDEELFVFDRNGIWRLRDTDGNGEADVHELFCNAFAQTAETREYANGIRPAPDGSFVIAKGGQQGTTTGKQNGMVLRVSPDGRSARMIGWGLRQPFIGVHPVNGLVTASDQQGNYVPTTPLHVIRDQQFYGFVSLLLPRERYPAPIAEPLTWIPHAINASGAGQVWLTPAKMGPLNGGLIHLGYYRPEIFRVLWNERASRPQAAVVSITRDLEFAPLNGAVNPIDGQLYVTGFQIWGTVARQISGLARLRFTGVPWTLPRELVPMDKGVLLRFDVPLDARRAVEAANFSAERWNYRRTAGYGSPHFRLDGSKGQESLTPSSAYLSKDRHSVFVGIPDMKPVMQMRLGWSLTTSGGENFAHNAYCTPRELVSFDPAREGFEALTVDLTPRKPELAAAIPATAEEGKRVAELMGCVACHSTDGTTLGKVGPTWKGLFGRQRFFVGGTQATADEAYLRESIKDPAAKVIRDFEKSDTGMPSYEGVISDAQIEALVLYLKTLR